jgi:hypothetical protein
MTIAADPVARLRAIAGRLDDPGDRQFLLDLLNARRGARCRLADRDRLLAEAAERFFADLSCAGQARAVTLALTRYGASAWRNDRTRERCPYQAGELRSLLWRAFQASDGRAISAERLRKILVTFRGGSDQPCPPNYPT